MMRRCKDVRGANNSLAPSTRPEDRVGHSADSSLSRAARVPWLWRRDGIAHKRGKKEAKGKERKKKKEEKNRRLCHSLVHLFAARQEQPENYGTHGVPSTHGVRGRHTWQGLTLCTCVRMHTRERERERSVGREAIDFFCPQATKAPRQEERGGAWHRNGQCKSPHRQPPRYTT